MADYPTWENWLNTNYTELLVIVSKMGSMKTKADIISIRKDYAQKCDEWLMINDVMRQRIISAKERAIKQSQDVL